MQSFSDSKDTKEGLRFWDAPSPATVDEGRAESQVATRLSAYKKYSWIYHFDPKAAGNCVNTTMSSWAAKQPEYLKPPQTPEAGRASQHLLVASTMSNASFAIIGTTYATPADNKENTVAPPPSPQSTPIPTTQPPATIPFFGPEAVERYWQQQEAIKGFEEDDYAAFLPTLLTDTSEGLSGMMKNNLRLEPAPDAAFPAPSDVHDAPEASGPNEHKLFTRNIHSDHPPTSNPIAEGPASHMSPMALVNRNHNQVPVPFPTVPVPDNFTPSSQALETMGVIAYGQQAQRNPGHRYQGSMETRAFRSQVYGLPNRENCALYITWIPVAVMLTDLFEIIRTGDVECLYLQPPCPPKHPMQAAKLHFKTPEAAEAFHNLANSEPGIWMHGVQINVVYNRDGVRRHPSAVETRVLNIEGPQEIMNIDFWNKYLTNIGHFQIEVVLLPCERPFRVAFQFRFARIEAQAKMVFVAIRNTREFDGVVQVEYGLDPCNPASHSLGD